MSELEDALTAAKLRIELASKALRAKHRGGEWQEYDAARAVLLAAERALAASRNEQHAIALDFPVRWNVGAPLPQLLADWQDAARGAVNVRTPDSQRMRRRRLLSELRAIALFK